MNIGELFERDYAIWVDRTGRLNQVQPPWPDRTGRLTPINRWRFAWEILVGLPGWLTAARECRATGHAETNDRGWCTRCGAQIEET